jgi:hypothetical protein
MRRVATSALWVALAACKRDEPDAVVSDDTPVADDLPSPTSTCPADALPATSALWSTQVDFDWSWSAERSLSYAAPVYVRLPDGELDADEVVSWALTVDAGEAETAFARVWVDGKVVVDVDRAGAFEASRRSLRRSGRLEGGDTWDTWWDTFPDSFDSYWDSAWDSSDTGWVDTEPGWGVWPLYHLPDVASTLVLPMAPEVNVRGGCLAVVPAATEDLSGRRGRLHVAARAGDLTAPTLRMNVVVVDGAGIAPRELELAVESMRALYAAGGAPALEVAVFDLAWGGPALFNFTEDLYDLRASEIEGALSGALNMFVIQDFVGSSGTIGIAAGIPGATGVQRTAGSGVVVTVDGHRRFDGTVDPDALGGTMAHEAGHQLGLFHTSESSGQSFDVLRDTLECPLAEYDRDGDGTVWAGECRKADGRNFMFWTEGGTRFDQREITEDQVWVLNHAAWLHEGGE